MTELLVETAGLTQVYDKVLAGERLTYDDGLELYQNPNLNAVGALANIVRERMNGDKTYYVRNQHINYTNVCNKGCKFCAFYAQKGGPDPYTMSIEEVQNRLRAHLDIPIKEVHMVAGHQSQTALPVLSGFAAGRQSRPARRPYQSVYLRRDRRNPASGEQAAGGSLRRTRRGRIGSACRAAASRFCRDRVHMELFGRKLVRRPVDRDLQSGGARRA